MVNVLSQWCVKFTFRDSKGQTRSIQICYESDLASIGANAAAFQTINDSVYTALAAMSNAHVTQKDLLNGVLNQRGVTYGTAAEYNSVSDQAWLYYLSQDQAGNQGKSTIVIPAPVSSIFEADQVTVNPASGLVTALNTALNVGGVATSAPVTMGPWDFELTSFVGGVRKGRKLSRRWTKFTKDPTLTIAGI